MKNLISIKNVTVTYPNCIALNNISVSITDQQNIIGIIGPNGAGKTTLIHSIMDICKNRQGEINVLSNNIAYCPDVPSFEPCFIAKEIMEQSLALAEKEVNTSKIQEYLDIVGLGAVGNKLVKQFSRGMKQRLAIASALILEPELLFLDEPTSALDPLGKAEIIQLIKSISKNITIIVSSHQLSEMEKMVDSLIVLEKGNLIYNGNINDFLHENRTDCFITCCNELDASFVLGILQDNNIIVDSSQAKNNILKIEEKYFDQVFRILAEFPNTIESIQRSNYSLDTAFLAAVMKYKDTYYEKTN